MTHHRSSVAPWRASVLALVAAFVAGCVAPSDSGPLVDHDDSVLVKQGGSLRTVHTAEGALTGWPRLDVRGFVARVLLRGAALRSTETAAHPEPPLDVEAYTTTVVADVARAHGVDSDAARTARDDGRRLRELASELGTAIERDLLARHAAVVGDRTVVRRHVALDPLVTTVAPDADVARIVVRDFGVDLDDGTHHAVRLTLGDVEGALDLVRAVDALVARLESLRPHWLGAASDRAPE